MCMLSRLGHFGSCLMLLMQKPWSQNILGTFMYSIRVVAHLTSHISLNYGLRIATCWNFPNRNSTINKAECSIAFCFLFKKGGGDVVTSLNYTIYSFPHWEVVVLQRVYTLNTQPHFFLPILFHF